VYNIPKYGIYFLIFEYIVYAPFIYGHIMEYGLSQYTFYSVICIVILSNIFFFISHIQYTCNNNIYLFRSWKHILWTTRVMQKKSWYFSTVCLKWAVRHSWRYWDCCLWEISLYSTKIMCKGLKPFVWLKLNRWIWFSRTLHAYYIILHNDNNIINVCVHKNDMKIMKFPFIILTGAQRWLRKIVTNFVLITASS